MGTSRDYVNEIPPEYADVPSELLQLLMQLGYVACGQGHPKSAATIFEGVAAVRPNTELPLIGLAVALLNQGKLKASCDLLIHCAGRMNPDNQLVKAIAGMIFRITGAQKESDIILDEVIESNSDPEAVALAKELKNDTFTLKKRRGVNY